ncbi:MAG: xylan 1,4-beta-xylosidase [Clostridia bacterium]|nr:xylan 1,4-beta-xylosidase [Clostridia bacterium]
MKKSITINTSSAASFKNHASFCIGTGRMGLALQEEYQKQLSYVQSGARFSHIRGHGLFSDDMAIYHNFTNKDGEETESYCFTYLDRVMDSYLEKGLKPFLELGFMPKNMASGTQTVFYWQGNVTPPKDDEKWIRLVKTTLTHLIDRYGEEEAVTWPIEVWNEPNLPVFWENADKAKYLHLYEITAKAVKEVNPRFTVGGPAICGGEGSQQWISDFLTYVRDHRLPLDFVTRHAYMGQTPERNGRYLYHTMCDVSYTYNEMKESRRIIDSFPEFRGMDMHITEFNTSYNPFCPIHDTNYNAANIAGLLSVLGDVARSYSYWTFGDVFEEMGVPARPFHGGFGLIANGLIPKPTYWTFVFFNNLKGDCVYKDENAVIMREKNGSYQGVIWNIQSKHENALETEINLPITGEYALVTKTVDEESANPLKVWHDMGEKQSLTREETETLRLAGQPLVQSRRVSSTFTIQAKPNAVIHFALSPVKMETEKGYDYHWYEKG